MVSLLKHRLVMMGAGILLLAAFVWYAGPLFAFAGYAPLASVRARVVVIALLLAGYLAWLVVRRVQAARANRRLAAALVAQADDRPSAEVLRLRERFEEAVSSLRTSSSRGGQGIYDLPWYVFIGAPGSGKTTALLNSGLRFPLEQAGGRGGALRGVGGTRNCDWWFTDQAVFLDTAGRYTTQDSDAAADGAAWREFLSLLRTHRGRRPLNGIILTVSASDVLTQGAGEREAYIEAARRRLQEIQRELQIQLPVYVMVTKCDLVAGFTEYFDDLEHAGRAQVWGTTFPWDASASGTAAADLPAAFDALVERLLARVPQRLAEERDVRRRVRLFAFPQQMAALREGMATFVSEVFGTTRFDRPVLLRGVYFTSGTQEGTPIDRLLGAIGRRYAVAPEAVAPSGRGKAYFIERLLRDVVLAESGLAGVNRRVELRNAALQLGAHAAVGVLAMVVVILLIVSYGRNRAYVADVSAEVERVREAPAAGAAAPIDRVVARLDALRDVVDVAERHHDRRPWTMRAGLFQGSSLGNAARDTYVRELNTLLLPRVVGRLEQQLNAFLAPELVYDYLKAYLMLGGEAPRVDAAFLTALAAEGTPADDRLRAHFVSLVGDGTRLRSIQMHETLVRQGRRTIQRASIPHLIFRQIVRYYDADTRRALRLDEASGAAAARVLSRRSGVPLSEPQPAVYTRAVFQEVTGTDALAELVRDYASEQWVWGEGGAPPTAPATLQAEVLRIYEDAYIDHWDELVDDVTVAPMRGAEVTEGLATLSGPASPLRIFYETVRDHTRLVTPPEGQDPAAGPSFRDRAAQFGRGLLSGTDAPAPDPPGTRVTAHFAAIHALVGDNGGGPIDRVLGEIRRIQQTLAGTGAGIGQGPTDARTQVEVQAGVRALNEQAETLPAPVGAFVRQVGEVAVGTVTGSARSRILGLYREAIVAECTQLARGRYPVAPQSPDDVPLADFGRLFAPSGVFDRFFTEVLAEYVDTTRRPWAWRPGAGLGLSGEMPRQFERARDIRDAFFRAGGDLPQTAFSLEPTALDTEVLRFRLRAGDRNVLEHAHGPARVAEVRWPADAPPVVATFEDGAGRPPYLEYDGDWAWFRLLDGGELRRENDRQWQLQLRSGGRSVQLLVTLPTLVNVLERRDRVRNFPCDAS